MEVRFQYYKQMLNWQLTQVDKLITSVLLTTDTHGLTHKLPNALPPGDVLLHAGDFSNTGLPKEIDKFIAFLTEQPHPIKVRLQGDCQHCIVLVFIEYL